MPRYSNDPAARADRRAHQINRMERDMRQIADESPDSETKEQMKARMMARQRVTMGDAPTRESEGSLSMARKSKAKK